MKTYFAVTAVILNNGEVLILRKALSDWNYPGKWGFCSGYVKEFEAAEDTAIREVKEETGLAASIIRGAGIIISEDKTLGKRWAIAPFLCESTSRDVRLCHENIDFRWIKPKELKKFDTVPGAEEDINAFGLV